MAVFLQEGGDPVSIPRLHSWPVALGRTHVELQRGTLIDDFRIKAFTGFSSTHKRLLCICVYPWAKSCECLTLFTSSDNMALLFWLATLNEILMWQLSDKSMLLGATYDTFCEERIPPSQIVACKTNFPINQVKYFAMKSEGHSAQETSMNVSTR